LGLILLSGLGTLLKPPLFFGFVILEPSASRPFSLGDVVGPDPPDPQLCTGRIGQVQIHPKIVGIA